VTIAQMRESLRRAAMVVRRVVGAPDYDRYLAHVQACHPERPPLSRHEFERERVENKYNKPGNRCC
jgi:uncharacterized short protein YbdD (DUF466 family)